MAQAYTWADLERIRWLGDDRLGEFLVQWRKVTTNFPIEMPEESLCSILRDRLSRASPSSGVGMEVADLDRLDPSDPRLQYKSVLGMLDRVLSRQRMITNRQNELRYKREGQEKKPALPATGKQPAGQQKNRDPGRQQAVPAAPAKPGGEPKGDGKGRGRRSQSRRRGRKGRGRGRNGTPGRAVPPARR